MSKSCFVFLRIKEAGFPKSKQRATPGDILSMDSDRV